VVLIERTEVVGRDEAGFKSSLVDGEVLEASGEACSARFAVAVGTGEEKLALGDDNKVRHPALERPEVAKPIIGGPCVHIYRLV
jgi:hypothetical protein